MESDKTDQTTQLPPNDPRNPVAPTSVSSLKLFTSILIGLVIICITIVSVYYYADFRNSLNENIATQVTTYPTQPPTPTVGSIPSVKPGFQLYTNSELRYGFQYPETDSLYRCPDIHCVSIYRNTLDVEILDNHTISSTDTKLTLFYTDLFCSADSPNGSISCQNTSVEDYTNHLGYKGYKVIRTRTVRGTGGGIALGNYPDFAYVYMLPEVKNTQRAWSYEAVLFGVENPTHENLTELTSIADTFFTF